MKKQLFIIFTFYNKMQIHRISISSISIPIIAPFAMVLVMLGLFSVIHAQTETICIYEATITPEDRVNSRGIALKNPSAILIQERVNAHRRGNIDEEYFTTPERRAQIPEMLKRGKFNQVTKNAVLNGDSPFLFIEVLRDKAGVTSMNVQIRIRNPDDYPEGEEGLDDAIADDELDDWQRAFLSLEITKGHPHHQAIMDLVEKAASELAKEPILADGSVYLLDDWARVQGKFRTKSGKPPVHADDSILNLYFISVLRRRDDTWNVLYWTVAGDMSPLIEIQNKFPTIPEALFRKLPEVPADLKEAPKDTVVTATDLASKPLKPGEMVDVKGEVNSEHPKFSYKRSFSEEGVSQTAISQDGNWVAAQTYQDQVKVFSGGGDFQPYAVIDEKIRSVTPAFSRRGKTLFMMLKNELLAWDVASKSFRDRHTLSGFQVETITGTANENLVFLGGSKGRVILLNIAEGKIITEYEGMCKSGIVYYLRLSHDGSRLFASGTAYKERNWIGGQLVTDPSPQAYAVVWDTETAKPIFLHNIEAGRHGVAPAHPIAISRKGTMHAIRVDGRAYEKNSKVTVFGAQPSDPKIDLSTGLESVFDLSFSADGTLLFALSSNGFEAKSIQLGWTVARHQDIQKGGPGAPSFAHDAQFVITCVGEERGENRVLYWHPIANLLDEWIAFLNMGEATPEKVRTFVNKYPGAPLSNILKFRFGIRD